MLSSGEDPLENIDLHQNFRSLNQSINNAGVTSDGEMPFAQAQMQGIPQRHSNFANPQQN